ncbi:MAG: peptidoglycan-binding domain-containing protein [Chthoniobacterales bacterium]
MRKRFFAFGLVLILGAMTSRADSLTESAQGALKEQGFYYGEVTGRKDADTTAAIRRYQIRNGLKITGEINAETQKSLGVKGRLPVVQATPAPPLRVTPPHENVIGRGQVTAEDEFGPTSSPDLRLVFTGGPYANSSAEAQRELLVRAQSVLAQQGYYRSEIDGVYGPGMAAALRAYQARFGMNVSGRLDSETLAVLGLLPGQVAPGVTAPRTRFSRRPTMFTPRGERVYTPR